MRVCIQILLKSSNFFSVVFKFVSNSTIWSPVSMQLCKFSGTYLKLHLSSNSLKFTLSLHILHHLMQIQWFYFHCKQVIHKSQSKYQITAFEKKIQFATKYQRVRVRVSKNGLDPAWPGPWTVYLVKLGRWFNRYLIHWRTTIYTVSLNTYTKG